MSARRSIANFVTGSLQSALVLLVGMVATPAVLRWLGREPYGAYRILQEWVGYLGLLELGLFGSLLANLAPAVARGDLNEQRGLLSAGTRAYLWVTGATLLAGGGLTLAIGRLVPVHSEMLSDLRLGCAILLATFVFQPFQAQRAYLDAAQRSYWVNAAALLQSLAITAFALLLSRAGWGIRGQALAALIGAALYAVVIQIAMHRQSRGSLRGALAAPAPPESRSKLLRLQWPVLLNNACGRICLMTDNIVISIVLGPAAVTPFFLTQRLILVAQYQLQGIGNATWASLGGLYTREREELFRERLLELTKLTSILSVGAIAPLIAFNRDFVILWVGRENYGGSLLTLAACGNALLLPALTVWGWVFTATGKVRELTPLMIAQTAVNLVLSIGFTYAFGLPGPVLGTLAAYLLTQMTGLPYLLQRRFAVPPTKLLMAYLPPVALGSALAAGLALIRRHAAPLHWGELLIGMSAMALAYLAAAGTLLLNGRERGLIRARLNGLLPGRSGS